MKKYIYKHDRGILDFDLNSIAKGLEYALSDGCTIKETDLKEDLLLLQGDFPHGIRQNGRVRAEIILDKLHGELIETQCECHAYYDDHFQCEHICALLGQYFWETEGLEELKDTELERALSLLAGVPDPFLPGILRKTDHSLQSFLSLSKKQKVKLDKPKWIEVPETEKKIPLSIEVVINIRNEGFGLELKAGPKRHYVIRDLSKLTQAYRNQGNYQFSNSIKCAAGRNQYVTEDRDVMDFVSQLCQVSDNPDTYFSFYTNSSHDYYREIYIYGRDLDAFMELMNGRRFQLNSRSVTGSMVTVDLEQEPEAITLEKKEFGAVLSGANQEAIACGMKWMYVCQNQRILRLPAEQWKKRQALLEAVSGKKEVYIQDKDLPAVCEGLRQIGVLENQLVVAGMNLEEYTAETPEIQIYLDYPQEDLITCQVKAKYPLMGKTFNVLDQSKEKRKRDLYTEQMAGEAIWAYFTAYDEAGKQMCLSCDENILYTFLTETIPELSKRGELFISDRMKKLKVRPAPEVSVGLQVDAGSLVMSLHSNSMTKEEMIQILSAFNSKRKFTRLKNGEFIVMPESDLRIWETISETYKAYGKKNPEAMKLPLFRALYLQESLQEREDTQLEEGERYKDLIRDLSDEESWDAPLPDSLQEILREYQKEGFQWISMLKKNGFGGILADDMGLGKTLQVLAFLLAQKKAGNEGEELRTLIVAPASLIYNWKKEISIFTPELTCQVIAGTIAQRTEMITQIRENAADIYITSYDLLKRDIAQYEGIVFANQIIDEAQYIKNQNTQVAKAVRLLDSSFHLALTGTPIENRLSELWSIFDFLMPGFLYGYTRFRSEFEMPVINDHDEAVMKRLRSMVHPFILRRLKKDVLQDLPDKIEETITILLEGAQRKLYDAYAERLRLYLDKQSDEEFHQRKLEILAELTRLRQICCGPDIFLENYTGDNAKKEACMELVHQAMEGGHKVLLFSQFTSVLDDLGKRLSEEQIEYHRIDGSVSKEERMRQVEAFAGDEVPLFLISLKAGGTGLNLTAADIVIHYDPWWNVAAQNQATDRTHRIGQENTVTVYQLIAENTIEEQIAVLQKTKAQLAEDILEGEGIASIMINKEEILRLL